ncbi:hypothetical protein AB9F42_36145, partial [Rhizobium leguminosarum]
ANDIDSTLSEILALEKQRMKAADYGAEAQYTTTRTMMVSVAAVALLIAAFTAFWIAFRHFAHHAVGTAEALADRAG